MGIVKGSDVMVNQNGKLIDEKDDGAFDDRMVSIFRVNNGVTRLVYSNLSRQ